MVARWAIDFHEIARPEILDPRGVEGEHPPILCSWNVLGIPPSSGQRRRPSGAESEHFRGCGAGFDAGPEILPPCSALAEQLPDTLQKHFRHSGLRQVRLTGSIKLDNPVGISGHHENIRTSRFGLLD